MRQFHPLIPADPRPQSPNVLIVRRAAVAVDDVEAPAPATQASLMGGAVPYPHSGFNYQGVLGFAADTPLLSAVSTTSSWLEYDLADPSTETDNAFGNSDALTAPAGAPGSDFRPRHAISNVFSDADYVYDLRYLHGNKYIAAFRRPAASNIWEQGVKVADTSSFGAGTRVGDMWVFGGGVLANGNLIALVRDPVFGLGPVYSFVSTDQSVTWGSSTLISNTDNPGFGCAVIGSHAYYAFIESSVFYIGDYDGASWTLNTPTLTLPSGHALGDIYRLSLEVDSSGILHLELSSATDGYSYVYSSNDNGATWDGPRQLTVTGRTPNFDGHYIERTLFYRHSGGIGAAAFNFDGTHITVYGLSHGAADIIAEIDVDLSGVTGNVYNLCNTMLELNNGFLLWIGSLGASGSSSYYSDFDPAAV